MNKQALILVFDHNTTTSLSVWKHLHALLREQRLLEDAYEVFGVEVSSDKILAYLDREKKLSFVISGARWEFDYNSLGRHELDLLHVRGEPTEWNNWVLGMRGAGKFVQGLVVDVDYDFWQNAEDPLQYKVKGRSYDHLPMRSNGLPFPLEQKVVDVSGNPGRRVLRRGYIEAVAADMWLGEQFWARAGSRRASTLSRSEFRTIEMGDVVRVSFQDGPFTDSSGASRELQQQVRQMLFPATRPT